MAVYAIGDLHFSPNDSKPMDIFGWGDHKEKILRDWNARVQEEDIVIVAGDVSWAMKFDEAKENLDTINQLKGKKIILKGNHDYWWQSLAKMHAAYPEILFLHNNHYSDDQVVIFGTRGWVVPQSADFTEDDQRVFDREMGRLKLSMDSYTGSYEGKTTIVAMHYPPVNEKNQDSQLTQLMKDQKIDHMLYGHLHGIESFRNVFEGEKNGTMYHLVSADFMDFKLKKILD